MLHNILDTIAYQPWKLKLKKKKQGLKDVNNNTSSADNGQVGNKTISNKNKSHNNNKTHQIKGSASGTGRLTWRSGSNGVRRHADVT